MFEPKRKEDLESPSLPARDSWLLTVERIREWVDAYRVANGGSFPARRSGAITDREGKDTGENWGAIEALFKSAAKGRPARGLQGSGFNSLKDFLDKTYPTARIEKPDLTLSQLQDWVDAYREVNGGSFPAAGSGAIKDREGKDTGESWRAVDKLLRAAAKGLPARGLQHCGFKSLTDFLDKTYPTERTARIEKPDLTLLRLQDWVDAYREVNGGSFPAAGPGAIKDREGKDTGETWKAVDALLRDAAKGAPARGLKGCGFNSLKDFLDKTYPTERKARTKKPDLILSQLQEWVDAYREANGGSFPAQGSGAITDREGKDTGENWAAVNALFQSAAEDRPARGLQGCGFNSLADFLDKTYPTERKVRPERIEKPDLTLSQLQDWVDAYREANRGRFPSVGSGAITDREGKDTGESWKAVDSLFKTAAQGFPGRGLQGCGFNSLSDFLDKTYPTERKARTEKPDLTLSQLKDWVDAYRDANGGSFPKQLSGAITDREGKDTGENWAAIDALFRAAAQGFPARGLKDCGFKSLKDFLDKTYPTERQQQASQKPIRPRGDNINPLLDLLE